MGTFLFLRVSLYILPILVCLFGSILPESLSDYYSSYPTSADSFSRDQNYPMPLQNSVPLPGSEASQVNITNTAYGTQFLFSAIQPSVTNNTIGTTSNSSSSTVLLLISAPTEFNVNITVGNAINDSFSSENNQTRTVLSSDSLLPQSNGITTGSAIQVQTNTSVTVQLVVANSAGAEGEGTLVYPINAIGAQYIVSTLGQFNAFVVTAAENTTIVNLTFSNGTSANYSINSNDVLYFGDTNLNGTVIESSNNKPISVLAGRTCGNLSGETGNAPCSYLLEALPPTNTFGRNFVFTSQFIESDVGDLFNSNVEFLFTATVANTTVIINGNNNMTLTRANEVFDFPPSNEINYFITANNPILVTAILSPRGGANNETQVNLIPTERFFTFSQFQAISSTSATNNMTVADLNTLVLIVNSTDLNNTSNYLTFNDQIVDTTQFQSINEQFSTVSLPTTVGSEPNTVNATYRFGGYYFASVNNATLNYGSAINRFLGPILIS
jgi:hypothetical protein